MVFGINVDMRFAQGRGEPMGGFQALFDSKVRGLRYTSFNNITQYGAAAQAVGLKCLVVETGESQGFVYDDTFTPDYVQINNEPDVNEAAKSRLRSLATPHGLSLQDIPHPRYTLNTYLPPDQMADFWVLYRNTYENLAEKGVKFFGPGLASGSQSSIDYWRQVDQAIGSRAPKPDALAIHPYWRAPEDAAQDFDDMWNAFGIDVIATEWFWSSASQYIWDEIAMLNDPNTGRSTDWNSFFCLDDTMVNGFGLCNNGSPKDEWFSLMSSPNIP